MCLLIWFSFIYAQNDDKSEKIVQKSTSQVFTNSSKNKDKDKCFVNEKKKENIAPQASSSVSVTGYLSVFANGVDNFTHGLAIAASFSAGLQVHNNLLSQMFCLINSVAVSMRLVRHLCPLNPILDYLEHFCYK